jgi:hypothetical protein
MSSVWQRLLPDGGRSNEPRASGLLRRPGRDLLIFGLYALLTIAMTWPVTPRITTHIPGQGGDLWVHWWNLWWLKDSLLEGHTPFYTTCIFHPQGVPLVYHNFAWAHFLAWLPLQALVGAIPAFDVIVLLMFALSGYTMFLLAREVTGSGWAGFVAGAIYAFWPYTQTHFDHPNFRAIPWFPLALLYLRRLLREGRRRDVVGLSLAIALVGLTRWQLLTVAAILLGWTLLTHWLTEPDVRRWRRLLQVVLAGVVGLALLLPLLSPILSDLLRGSPPAEVMIDERTWGQTDLLAYVLPSRYHPLWGDAMWSWYENLIVNKVYVAFVGCVTLGLALLGLLRARRGKLLWGVLALIFLFLALGPVLRVDGRLFEWVPMPYRLVGDLIFVRAMRKPDRFNIALGLPLAMLAAWGIEALRRRLPSRLADGATLLLAGLILFEYWIAPFPTVRPDAPAWYDRLRDEPGRFAILDLPLDPVVYDKAYMGYQVVHGKPLVGGKISRPTPEVLSFITDHPFLRGLYEENEMDPALTDVSRQLGFLAENDVRYLVLHEENLSPEKLARWRDWLTVEPAYESGALLVYRTRPRAGRDFQLDRRVSPSLGLIEHTVTPTSTSQGALVTVDARWGSTAPPDRPLDLALRLVDPAGETVQSQRVPLSPDWPTDQWPANAVVRARYALQLDPFLPPGRLSLTLTPIDRARGVAVSEPLTLETIAVQELPRSFDAPAMAHRLDVAFGDGLDLLGYDAGLGAERLDLTLHWRARERLDVPYKFFVHLYDAESGEVVAQADVMPRDWSYPTTWWEEGEVVSDEISLPLQDVPPGTYRVGVGVYHPDTGDRLPVTGAEPGLAVEERRLTLPDVLRP